MCYHVINRGNGRAEVFHKEDDYAAFVDLLDEANERLPMRVLGYVPDAQPFSPGPLAATATAT